MDDDSWRTQRRGRGTKFDKIPDHPRDRAWMDAHCPPYSGSAADYDRDHYKQHGRAEGMVDGMHVKEDGRPDPNPRFPQGSRREAAHRSYSNSTMARNTARDDYNKALDRHTAEFEDISDVEKQLYYDHVAKGLLPRDHEDLAPRAERWDEKSYRQVRLCFLGGTIVLTEALDRAMGD